MIILFRLSLLNKDFHKYSDSFIDTYYFVILLILQLNPIIINPDMIDVNKSVNLSWYKYLNFYFFCVYIFM